MLRIMKGISRMGAKFWESLFLDDWGYDDFIALQCD